MLHRPTLSPRDAAWLTETIARNRSLFGGFSMEADPSGTDSKPDADKADPGKKDEPLGDAGKKALEDERTARKQAESDLKALRSEFDGFKTSLSEAFGVKSAKGDDGDAIKQVQDQLASMQREAAVYRIAAQHKITDDGDLELLKSAKDEQAMNKLGERLAAKAEDDKKPGTPKPDATQGAKGDPAKPDPGPGLPRLAAAYAASETTGTT